jgi:hypothetical protein
MLFGRNTHSAMRRPTSGLSRGVYKDIQEIGQGNGIGGRSSELRFCMDDSISKQTIMAGAAEILY